MDNNISTERNVFADVLADYGITSNISATAVSSGSGVIVTSGELTPPPINDYEEAEYEEASEDNQQSSSEALVASVEEAIERENTNAVLDNSEEAPSTSEVPEDTSNMTTEELVNLLPTNSDAVLLKESTARFSGASWFNKIREQTVVIAGQGGIGSWATMILTRMHPLQIFIYDDDTVETVNLAGQFFGQRNIGSRKVNAVADNARDFSDYYSIMASNQKWTEDTPAADIMICGFDNMEARSTFFRSWVNHLIGHRNPEKCLFIDGRLAFSEFQVYCLTGTDSYNIQKYSKECLFADWDTEETVCSMKQTTYCASMIGSIIVNLFTNFIANSITPRLYDIPYKTYYNANMMYFKTES